jgi:hypothetical protein
MHGLELIIRRNALAKEVPHPLRLHPKIWALRCAILGMGVGSEYRILLFQCLYRYAHQFVERPVFAPGEGWSDLEALQQVTLRDWFEDRSTAAMGHVRL